MRPAIAPRGVTLVAVAQAFDAHRRDRPPAIS